MSQSPTIDLSTDFYANIGYLIRRVHQVADAIFEHEMQDHGLTPVQYGILIAVSAHSGIDQFQLGRAIGFDRTTISYVVRRLEAKGLVRRHKDGADKRSNLLTLTPEGEALLAIARPVAKRAQERVMKELDPAQRERLMELLNAILHTHEAQAQAPRIKGPRTSTGQRLG